MKKQFLVPEGLTAPLSAYSHGIKANNMIFTTGQVAMDPTGAVVFPNDAKAQTEFIFQNLKNILAAGGATFEDVVKMQIFVTNIEDYAAIAEIRSKYLSTSKPASTLVEVKGLVKPGCCVEIEVIAVV